VEIRFKWLLHTVIYICVIRDFNGLFCILNRPSVHSAFLETQSSVGLYTVIPRLTSDPANEIFRLTNIFSLFFGLG
jgi:hypothetical protein